MELDENVENKKTTEETNPSNIIFDGEDLRVLKNICHNSNKLVITFSPRIIPSSNNLEMGYGSNFLKKNNISFISFIAKKNHWWQTPEFNLALDLVKDDVEFQKYKCIWTYGSSMGGTGALMAAESLNAKGVIAIIPQWSIDIKKTSFEPRWISDRNILNDINDDWIRPSKDTQVYFIFDPYFSLDTNHIKHLSFDINADVIKVPFSEHATPGMLREIDLLSDLILSILDSKYDKEDFRKKMRRMRSKSIMAIVGASACLLKKHKFNWALSLSNYAIEKSDELLQSGKKTDYTIIVRAISNHLSCLTACKKYEEILDAISIWSPKINNKMDFSRYKLQAGLQTKDSTIVFESLLSLWSQEKHNPTQGMIGSTISAIRSTLREDQIKKIHELYGKIIQATPYEKEYTSTLLKYFDLQFTDIDRNVGIGKEGYLFLTGGAHSVLDYATGRREPDNISYENFEKNIKRRIEFCNKHNIKYSHIIFPDKQSVLIDKIPVPNISCLGNSYISKNRGISSSIFYPKNQLKNTQDSFLKLDTHLSDLGYIKTASLILDFIQEQGSDLINTLSKQCNKNVKYAGDLGSKITPNIFDVRYDLIPQWNYIHLNNGLNVANDGITEIYINKNAPSQKRIFIFGDSFFRRISLILSSVFKEVVFFRTRFFHEEIIMMGNPDIVLTGQAERYLSVVDDDMNAPIFLLYPNIKGLQTTYDNEYIFAINSILSYRKNAYKLFSKKYYE